MHNVHIEVTIEDQKLRSTLYQTIKVEMQASETTRGHAEIEEEGQLLIINLFAQDLVAARALTNSILRLLRASVDVAESIKIS